MTGERSVRTDVTASTTIGSNLFGVTKVLDQLKVTR